MEGLATIDLNPRTGETRLLPRSADRLWQAGCCVEDPARGRGGKSLPAHPPADDRDINPDRQACTQGDDASLGTNRRPIAFGHAQHNRPHRRLS